jgi:hypothetical protein
LAKLIRVGRRVFDLDAVIAAEQRAGTLEVYLAGVNSPLQFNAGEAQVVWAFIAGRAESGDPPPSLTDDELVDTEVHGQPDFTVMEVLSDEAEDPDGPTNSASPLFRSINLPTDPLVNAILDRAAAAK